MTLLSAVSKLQTFWKYTYDLNTKFCFCLLVVVNGMHQLFGHIGVRANNSVTVTMLNACLQLIEDPSYEVRVAFRYGKQTDINLLKQLHVLK